MKWKGLKMDLECNKFNATVSQNISQNNIKNLIDKLYEITGIKEIPMILCNPIDYEFAKEALKRNNLYCNIIKSPYVEENTITVITDPNTKNEILGYRGCKNLFDEQ